MTHRIAELESQRALDLERISSLERRPAAVGVKWHGSGASLAMPKGQW